jgi:acetolactate synthase I/III small subunit
MSNRVIPSVDVKPAPKPELIHTHTLSVLVSNKPGVLGRICAVFSRRGYNIDSLVVSQGRDARFSRMTIGISGDPAGLEQIVLQVSKLIDVMSCQEHDDTDAVVREMLLVKVRVGAKERSDCLNIIEHYAGKTVDLQHDSLIAQIVGNTDKLDAAIRMLSGYEIIETVRTGKVVIARGSSET